MTLFYSKAPSFVQKFMPKGCLEFHEESWNAYPYSKTVITVHIRIFPYGKYTLLCFSSQTDPISDFDIQNPKYMKENFQLIIESMHRPGGPEVENVRKLIQLLALLLQLTILNFVQILNLSEEQLKMREVVHIDIANDRISSKDYKADLDPTTYRSKKTKRGPLGEKWLKSV